MPPTLVESADELSAYLDMLASIYTPTGRRALARIGPADAPADILFGVNDSHHDDPGRAAIRWLPTGEHGVSPTTPMPTEDVTFDAHFLTGIDASVTFTPTTSRVTTDAVRQALTEYIDTGRKPTTLDWTPPPPHRHHRSNLARPVTKCLGPAKTAQRLLRACVRCILTGSWLWSAARGNPDRAHASLDNPHEWISPMRHRQCWTLDASAQLL